MSPRCYVANFEVAISFSVSPLALACRRSRSRMSPLRLLLSPRCTRGMSPSSFGRRMLSDLSPRCFDSIARISYVAGTRLRRRRLRCVSPSFPESPYLLLVSPRYVARSPFVLDVADSVR